MKAITISTIAKALNTSHGKARKLINGKSVEVYADTKTVLPLSKVAEVFINETPETIQAIKAASIDVIALTEIKELSSASKRAEKYFQENKALLKELSKKDEALSGYKVRLESAIQNAKSTLEENEALQKELSRKNEVLLQNENKSKSTFKNTKSALQKLEVIAKSKEDRIEALSATARNIESALQKSEKLNEVLATEKADLLLTIVELESKVQKPKSPEKTLKYTISVITVFTVISIFFVFGREVWRYETLFAACTAAVFVSYMVSAIRSMSSNIEQWKKSLILAVAALFGCFEVVMHYLCFSKSISPDIVGNVGFFSFCLALLLSFANWSSILAIKKD